MEYNEIYAKRIKEILELESQIKDPEVAKDIDNSQKGKVEFEKSIPDTA